MPRLMPTLFPLLILATCLSASNAQEKNTSGDLLSKLDILAGKWVSKSPLRELPEGEVELDIQPSPRNDFLRIRGTYQAQDREPFEVFHIAAHWNPATQTVRYHALLFDGQEEGEVSIDDGRIVFKGNGVRFNGEAVSSTVVYERDGENLIVSLTGKHGDTVDKQRVVMRPRGNDHAPASESASVPKSEQIAEELQGTWRLDKGNGAYTLKTITGLSERLTRYDADGNVTHSQEAKFEVSESNGIRLFQLKQLKMTEGPDKGLVVPASFLGEYNYKVEGDTLIEVQGLKAGGRKMRTFRWKRTKADE